MATSKKTAPKKRAAKARTGFGLSSGIKLNRWVILLFVLVFGGIGGYLVYSSRAASADQLILSKEFVRPLVVTRDANDKSRSTEKRNYQDLAFQVYTTGEVVCGDPADPNSVTTTTLNSGQLKALQKQIESTGINSQPSGVVLKDGEVLLGDNVTTITYVSNGQQKTLITTADNPQSGVVVKVTALGENACKQATRKLNRAQATVPEKQKIQKNKSNSTDLENVVSYLKNQFAPKAEAEWWGYSKEAEDFQFRGINNVRAYLHIRQASPGFCEAISARLWSRNMQVRNSLYHSNVGLYRDQYCGGGWYMAAENIGVTPCPAAYTDTQCSDILFKAFANSPGHREHMLDGRLNILGVGAVRDRVTNKMWITHEFTGR